LEEAVPHRRRPDKPPGRARALSGPRVRWNNLAPKSGGASRHRSSVNMVEGGRTPVLPRAPLATWGFHPWVLDPLSPACSPPPALSMHVHAKLGRRHDAWEEARLMTFADSTN
jgi:hypothetical protein